MMIAVQADARALPFRAESVQCIVTSPPYFGLRDYGTARWEGGDPACDHRIGRVMGNANKGHVRDVLDGDRESCKCGAHRIDQQIGLEPTIDAYVAQLVTVFREVWRVLKPDGVCWLNLGDSYAGGGNYRGVNESTLSAKQRSNRGARGELAVGRTGVLPPTVSALRDGLKPKDLCMIPARVALALQADGWYLRSEIVWSKPNPMPESVSDRPTKAHEMIYLLAKSPTYYFDADAVRERSEWKDGTGWSRDRENRERLHGGQPYAYQQKRTKITGNRAALDRENRPIVLGARDGDKTTCAEECMTSPGPALAVSGVQNSDSGRNIRSVWHIATQPYPGAHFATMPEKLIERCILASSRARDVIGDPFVGSGTVARVALRLGRRALVSDLNPQYLSLVDDRTRVTFGLPFVEEDAITL